MGIETFTYTSSFNPLWPTSTDPKSEGDNHFRGMKGAIQATFPNLSGAMTCSQGELNILDGATLSTAELNLLDGVTSTTVELNKLTGMTATTAELNRLVGVTGLIQTQIDSKGAITGQTWTGTHVLPATTSIGNVSATEISYLDGVTSALQGQIDAKAPLASPALTGIPTAPTAGVGTNTTQVATMAAIVAAGLTSALPGQSLGFLWSSGPGTAAFSQTHTGYAQKESKGANIACAATIDLTAATGNLVHITGSTGPITDITIASGAEYSVVWDSTPTIMHNASKIILPGGADITVAAGDQWDIRGDGTNVARVKITRADGRPVRIAAYELVATITPTAAANIDFLTTFSATYDDYMIVANGLTISGAGGQNLAIRLANGGAPDSASNYWINAISSGNAVTAQIFGSGTVGVSVVITLTNVNDASGRNKAINFQGVGEASVGTYSVVSGAIAYVKAATVSGFRLFASSGNSFAATGEVRVYGIKRT
jgi:hypothetical protein